MNGKTNWLKGMILLFLYVMLVVTFWYYPGRFALSVSGSGCDTDPRHAGTDPSYSPSRC